MYLKQSSAFSISKGLKKTIDEMNDLNKMTPGPIYNISKIQQPTKNICPSIGKSQRSEINHGVKQTPSPGQYNPKQHKKDPIVKSFPKAIHVDIIEQFPDPSCYNPKVTVSKPSVLTYGLGGRYPSILQCKNTNPGPGNYQNLQPLPILTKSKSQKSLTFGTSSRFKYGLTQTPGVGNYQIISRKLSQQKFKNNNSIGKAKKLHLNQNTGPGPSDYPKVSFVQQNIMQKKGKSIQKKFEEGILSKFSLTSNAYNNYFQNPEGMLSDKQKSAAYSFGKQNRQAISYMDNPSPVEYINNVYQHRNSSNALVDLSKNVDYDPHINKPGPGTYQILQKPQIQYSFPRSKSMVLSNNIINSNPGAGRYNPKLIEKVKVHTFSKGQKLKYGFTESIGVGQYDINPAQIGKFHMSKLDNQNIKFNESQRFIQKFDRSPGPGHYESLDLVGNKTILKSK